MSRASYVTADDLFADWRDNVLSGTPPTLYPVGEGDLARVEVGPERVVLLGGAPGAGKTAFLMQCMVDLLRITPKIRVCVCNVEMPAGVLLDRQLARLSGVDLDTIRHRRLTGKHAGRIDQALRTLEALAGRLCFVRPPFDLANVSQVADDFGADVLLLDYIQRIAPPGKHDDRRGAVNATMDYLRQFADAGVAVVVVAAVSRTKDSKGRPSYDGDSLSLASFRESSELEFGADDAFILVPDEGEPDGVVLRHLKSRHGEAKDVHLHFDRRLQRFTPAGDAAPKGPAKARAGKAAEGTDKETLSQLQALWARTAPTSEVENGDDA